MIHLTGKYIKFLMIIAVLIVCFDNLKGQKSEPNTEELKVSIRQETVSRNFGCHMENKIYDNASFRKLTTNENCLPVDPESFKPDFESRSLIGFQVHGDCLVSARVAIFRNDKEKKYEIRIKNISGGCRAAGNFQGWLTIKKIPADYKVEISEVRVDKYFYDKMR